MGLQVLDAGEGGTYPVTLYDANRSTANPNGVVIPASAISTLTITLRDAASGAIVNARDGQNVKNANGGALDATSGAFEWTIAAADTSALDATADEEHVASFVATGSFEGSPLKWDHRLLCLTQSVRLCTFEDVDLHRRSLGASMTAGGSAIDESERAFVELMILAFTKRVEGPDCADRGLRRSTADAPTVEILSPADDAWSVGLRRWPVDSILSVKESSTGAFTADDASNPADLIASTEYAISADGILRMRNRPFVGGVGTLRVRYTGGLARATGAVPHDLRLAAMRQVAYWHQRKTALGVSGESRAGHSASFYATGDMLDDVKAVVQSYRRKVLAA